MSYSPSVGKSGFSDRAGRSLSAQSQREVGLHYRETLLRSTTVGTWVGGGGAGEGGADLGQRRPQGWRPRLVHQPPCPGAHLPSPSPAVQAPLWRRSQALGCYNNRIPAVKIVTYFLFNFFCSWRKRKSISRLVFPFRGSPLGPC